MNKKIKIPIIIAASLVLIGCIMIGGAMTMLQWNFRNLATVKYETYTYDIEDDFLNISINVDTSDIALILSEDSKAKVVCYESESSRNSVSVVGDTLTIEQRNTKKWYENIAIGFSSPKITVYLPRNEYDSLFIKTQTGDIEAPNDFKLGSADISVTTGDVGFSACVSGDVKISTSTGNINISDTAVGSLELSASTGKVNVTNVVSEGDLSVKVTTGKTLLSKVECASLLSKGSTGDITLKSVIASVSLNISRNTGDVTFEGCDAPDITVKTTTGDVTGSLLTEKLFSASSNTGKVSTPQPSGNEKCLVSTDTGKIILTVTS